MPSSLINFFNFYSRYLWNKDDFAEWQDGQVDSYRGSFEGLTGGAIVSGLKVTQVSGNQIRVSSGIALGVNGSLMYLDADYDVTLSAPVSDAERTLIVLRPLETANTLIDDPVNPGSTVYLKEQQSCEVIIVRGTASASPVYPSKGTNDVILAGVRVKTSGTIDGNWDFDYSIREILGRNRTSQRVDQSLYDDRLRPYRSAAVSISIKPSISGYPGSGGDSANPIAFTHISNRFPSLFPRTAGNAFNFADTVLNMATGAITGGDGLSPDFTPATVSAADRYRVGLIQIGTDDILYVKFHTADSTSKSAAFGLIFDATLTPDSGYKLICYFVLYSQAGSVWQDLDIIDARTPGNIVQVPQKLSATVNSTSFGGSGTSYVTTTDNLDLTKGTWHVIFFDSVYLGTPPTAGNACAAEGQIYNSTDASEICKSGAFTVYDTVAGYGATDGAFYISEVVSVSSAKTLVGRCHRTGSAATYSTMGTGKFYAIRLGD